MILCFSHYLYLLFCPVWMLCMVLDCACKILVGIVLWVRRRWAYKGELVELEPLEYHMNCAQIILNILFISLCDQYFDTICAHVLVNIRLCNLSIWYAWDILVLIFGHAIYLFDIHEVYWCEYTEIILFLTTEWNANPRKAMNQVTVFLQEREDGGRGRFKSHSNAPSRISDREKKAPLKT